jgi:hypothetical protein
MQPDVTEVISYCTTTTSRADNSCVARMRSKMSDLPRTADGSPSASMYPASNSPSMPSAAIFSHWKRAGLGVIVGAVIGAHIDRTQPGTIPAVPMIAIEGAGIGLSA